MDQRINRDVFPAGFCIGQWRDHFAWFPVMTYNGHIRWLRWVKARRAGTLENNWPQYSD